MNWKRIYHCLLIIALVISSQSLHAQSYEETKSTGYRVTKRLLSVENGLASHEVFCGVQDDAGFLWFGTRNGLNRYDGKNCLLFTRQRNNLQDNKVVQLAKDDANNLFIEYGSTGFQLTTNGKIDVMNAVTRQVQSLTAAFPRMPFKEQDIYWIANDGTNEINLLTAYPFRLWKYSTKNGFRLEYEMTGWNKKDSLAFSGYRSSGHMCVFGKRKALLKLTNQLPQYVISHDTVIAFTQKDILRSLPIGFNSRNDLLLSYNTKINPDVFNVGMITGSGSVRIPARTNHMNADSIKGKYWYQNANSVGGESCILYIGTEALYLWNENTFLKIVSKPEWKGFENLFLYRLFADNSGDLWLCTSFGVLQLKVEKNRFQQFFTSAQQNVESNSQARGILADGTGNVIANVWSHTFVQRASNIQSTGGGDEIKYAVVAHNSSLYVGGFNLFGYDKERNAIAKLPGSAGTEIWSMFSLNDSLLLLGRTDGFSLFNSNGNKFDSLRYANRNIPEAKFIYRIFKSDDTVWAVAENGLYKINRVKGGWTVENDQSSVIQQLSLLDAFVDPNGILWLATNGEGLYRWDRKANSIRQFNITSGFPSDILYRIEPDSYDNLWISSDYGLIRFNKKSFAVKTYTTTDGISHNEFNRASSFKAKDGRLFFGGIDGVNAFYPKEFIADTNILTVPLRITAFNQFEHSKNELVNKTTELLNSSEIRLAPGDQFFTLEFQLLDFAKNEGHHYAYKIEGVDKNWNYINENSIRISGLPYGKFILRVKAQNREGAWSKSELTIPLNVLKPFYLKWWFVALLALLLVMAVYWFIQFRIKHLAADKKKLEQIVNERTAQLKRSITEQSALLLEKDVLMKEIHHRVKNNLQVISGLLELQSKSLDDGTAKNALRDGRNRVRSIALIHQNLYQFENLSTIDLKRFVNDLSRQVESVFKKSTPVTLSIKVPDLHLDIDSAVPLGLILNELLTNSFKYAFDGVDTGEINLEVHSKAKGEYQLVYSDNGPGLPAGFDFTKASTLGIQLINDLSRQIGGNVKYETRDGAVFTINFTDRHLRKTSD